MYNFHLYIRNQFSATLSSIPYGSNKYDNSDAFDGDDEASGQWTTWEKACEDGIKYCLENLI